MIDFHTHVLPGIDDGAENRKMSVQMLKSAYNDGIDTVVATSHLYIEEESDIDHFIEYRQRSFNKLQKAMQEDGGAFPKIKLGCEVHLKPHISNYESIKKLVIEDTDYILLEMPYSSWSQSHFEAIYDIKVMGLKPIMAHIERFLMHKKDFPQIKSVEPLFQVNAESFLHKAMRKELLELYYNGYIHLLGSDMHNLDDRKNNLKEAYDIIFGRFGKSFAEYTEKNAKLVLENKPVEKGEFPKLGFFDKLKL